MFGPKETKVSVLSENDEAALLVVHRNVGGKNQGQVFVAVPTNRWTGTGDEFAAGGVSEETLKELIRKSAEEENRYFAMAGVGDRLRVDETGLLHVQFPTIRTGEAGA